MTQAQATARWRAIDRKRAEFLGYARRKFNIALRRHLIQFDKATSDAVIIGDLVRGVEFITEQPVREAFDEVYPRVATTFAMDTMNQVMKDRRKDFTESAYRDSINAWVAQETGARIVGITSTSRELMSRIIQRAFDEGLSIDKAKALIRQQFATYSNVRAERIARTEIVSASNLGSISGAEATGLTLNKTWLATRDDRTRADHIEADGQTVSLKDPFVVGGENLKYPGDPMGSASNVIQCRCTVVFEEPSAAQSRVESVSIVAPEQEFIAREIGVDARYTSDKFEELSEEYAKLEIDVLRNVNRFGNEQNAIAELQGFRGLPTVLDEARFNKLAESDDYVPIYRGLRGETQAEVDGYINQFKYGELRHSESNFYGAGQYFAAKADYEVAVLYADDKADNVIHALISKNAKIGNFKDMVQQSSDEIYSYRERVNKWVKKTYGTDEWWTDKFESKFPGAREAIRRKMNMLPTDDWGAWATARGYDAYRVRMPSTLDGREGKMTDYVVVLNRTKLFVKK